MTNKDITPYATNPDYSDNKHRCIFCDKICKNKERLEKHMQVCQITTFNILHNFHTKSLPSMCFEIEDEVLINGKFKAMTEINIYKDMIPYDTHFVNDEEDKKESDDFEIEIDENDIITNEIEIDYSEKFHSTIDTEEEECINCINSEEGKCDEHMTITHYEELHKEEIELDNNVFDEDEIEDIINTFLMNVEGETLHNLIEEKKNIENKVELLEYDSDESEEDEPFYIVETKDGAGHPQKDFYTKDGIYCDPDIYNPELAEWKQYNLHTFIHYNTGVG